MKKPQARAASGDPRGEARTVNRYEANEVVEFRAWPEKDGQERTLGYGRLVDISEGGVRFTYAGRIRKGQTMRVLSLQPAESVLQFDPVVSVRWVKTGDQDELEVGASCCAAAKRRFSPFED